MTVVADSCGRHDTIGGACSKESNTLRYGHHTWSQHACVENFLAEGARWGLGKRDLVSNINWYMNVPVEEDGTLGIVDGHLRARPRSDAARRDRRAGAGLQLPADQQPLQRLRPDAGTDDGRPLRKTAARMTARTPPRRSRMTFDTLLVANRGEIAVRIIRTARRIGLRTVAVFSDADRGAPHVRLADTAVRFGPARRQVSYLDVDAVLAAAALTGAGAIHPGYGFLSEDADFARRCEAAGLVFVGPSPGSSSVFGAKHTARAAAEAAGVPLLPGTGLLPDLDAALAAAGRARLPGDAQGHRRRRRHRHARLPLGRGTGRGLRPGAAGRGRQLLLRRRLPRAARRARPPRRGAGLRRRARPGGDARRPRLLAAAPPPEGDRGGARPRAARRRAATGWPQAHGRCAPRSATARPGPSSSSTTRRAARRPSSRSTPGCRSSIRSPRRSTASTWSSGCCGSPGPRPPTGARAARRADRRSCRRGGTPSRRGSTPRIPARGHRPSAGHAHPGRLPARRPRRHLGRDRHRGHHRLRPDAGQGDRPRRGPRTRRWPGSPTRWPRPGSTASRPTSGCCGPPSPTPTCGAATHTTATLDGVTDASPRIDVVRAGTLTTVQDWPGRIGLWHVGVPPCGPMDDLSFRLGNDGARQRRGRPRARMHPAGTARCASATPPRSASPAPRHRSPSTACRCRSGSR